MQCWNGSNTTAWDGHCGQCTGALQTHHLFYTALIKEIIEGAPNTADKVGEGACTSLPYQVSGYWQEAAQVHLLWFGDGTERTEKTLAENQSPGSDT